MDQWKVIQKIGWNNGENVDIVSHLCLFCLVSLIKTKKTTLLAAGLLGYEMVLRENLGEERMTKIHYPNHHADDSTLLSRAEIIMAWPASSQGQIGMQSLKLTLRWANKHVQDRGALDYFFKLNLGSWRLKLLIISSDDVCIKYFILTVSVPSMLINEKSLPLIHLTLQSSCLFKQW